MNRCSWIGHVQSRHGQERMNAEALRDLGFRVLFTVMQLGDVPQANRIAAVLALVSISDCCCLIPGARNWRRTGAAWRS